MSVEWRFKGKLRLEDYRRHSHKSYLVGKLKC